MALNSKHVSNENVFVSLAALFCVVVVLANIIAVKLVSSPFSETLPLPAGLLIYPFTFFISNLVTELFDAAKARFMVWLSFAVSIVGYLIILMTLNLPAYHSHMQDAFEHIFSLNGIMLFSSLTAYIASQLVDVKIYEAMKRLKGKLWLRLIVSSMIAQFVDAIIVCFGQLYIGLNLELSPVIKLIFISYFFKAGVCILITPLFYGAVRSTRKLLSSETP